MKAYLLSGFLMAGWLCDEAYACNRDREVVCVGDVAVTEGNNLGRVVGVNAIDRFSKGISIQITEASGRGRSLPVRVGEVVTQPLEKVSVGAGCTLGYCVGEAAVTTESKSGRIIAVNIFNQKVAIQIESAPGADPVQTVFTQSIAEISIARGCVYGVCVNDRAVTAGNNRGVVVAVNPFKATVSVKIDEVTGNPARVGDISTQDVRGVSIERECGD